MALRFAVYLVGLLIVLAAVYLLLTTTGVTAYVPVAILAVALLLLLGLGLMGAARQVHEPHDVGPRETVETRRHLGDTTEVRRRELP